jgi:hypothetical protein
LNEPFTNTVRVVLTGFMCEVPSPYKSMRDMGRYIVIIVCYSSAFRVPAPGPLKSYGTDQTYDGVAVSLMTSWIRSMTAGVATFTIGDMVDILGFDLC